MKESFSAYLGAQRNRSQAALEKFLPSVTNEVICGQGAASLAGLNQACRYVLDVGGKRIRPILCYSSAAALANGDRPGLDHAACAIELIHTYSLIHDDLPAMDDDDLRRGKPTLHKTHNEATAILVGDGLQAMAFQLLSEAPGLRDAQKVSMIRVLARAAGALGMVGGQFIDIQATNSDMALDDLKTMHSLKTGALIQAALALGGIAAEGTEDQLAALDGYGEHIGLAFQVVDDILDVEGETAALGKTRGKDGEANKPTYVKLLGLAGAKSEARRLLAKAVTSLELFGESATPLRQLAHYIVERDH